MNYRKEDFLLLKLVYFDFDITTVWYRKKTVG